MKIWKYLIDLEKGFKHVIKMPFNAKILSIQIQGALIAIWVICNERSPKEDRIFDIYPTGRDLPPDPGMYLATVQFGCFVWHIFENTKQDKDKMINEMLKIALMPVKTEQERSRFKDIAGTLLEDNHE